MDHPCYKCGHSVEDGKPFCSQCGAPQIRVLLPEAAVPAATGSVLSNDLPIFSSDAPAIPGVLSASALSTGIDWPTALRSCAVAALIAALVMTLGLMVPLSRRIGRRISGGQSVPPPKCSLGRQCAVWSTTRSGVRSFVFWNRGCFRDCGGGAVSHWRTNSPEDARRASAGRFPFQ